MNVIFIGSVMFLSQNYLNTLVDYCIKCAFQIFTTPVYGL